MTHLPTGPKWDPRHCERRGKRGPNMNPTKREYDFAHIGPEALEQYVGDRVILRLHSGNGRYDIWRGELIEGGEENQGEIMFKAHSLNGTKPQTPYILREIRHGDWLRLQNGKDMKDYVFIDQDSSS
jgi:hypothetical protein